MKSTPGLTIKANVMKRRLIKAIKGEKGQALPVVLVLLVLGGLLIVPCLSYASTSLNSGRIVEKNVSGLYAADAGVENALWCIKNSIEPIPEQLPENVNQTQVSIQTENKGKYTLYYGELIEVGEPPQIHYDYLIVDGEMVWIEEAQAYEYTITVTWQAESGYPPIHLEEVGVRLPVGYGYEPGSAANPSFDNNLSTDEPDDTLDGAGAPMLSWELPPPCPDVSEEDRIATQTFYVTGEGGLEGDYTWVKAGREEIGQVGEVIGILYGITATATLPEDGEITARVMADAILDEGTGEIGIILWQINPQ